MKKSVIMFIAIIAIVAIVVAVMMNNKKDDTNKDSNENKTETTSKLGEISKAEDLEKLVEKIYDGNDELPMLMTQTLDVTEDDVVKSFTGLEDGKDLEFLVASEPLMSSQAYSLVLAKVKSGVDANKIAEKMSDNIDTRKWICVSAEKLYATNSGDVVCLVMSSEEWATPVYNKFKELAGSIGKEYEKTEEIDLPEDMF